MVENYLIRNKKRKVTGMIPRPMEIQVVKITIVVC